MVNTVYIMRGIPGSGKSTRAKQIVAERGGDGVIHSTDTFHYVDGEYRWKPENVYRYHNYNFEFFCRSLEQRVPTVVVDNTNIRRKHFARYVVAAEAAGYEVVEVAMPMITAEEAFKRCIHNVPLEHIQKKIDMWEK